MGDCMFAWGFLFCTELYAAMNGDPSDSIGVSADWKETLAWMRTSTPEPFGDPAFSTLDIAGNSMGRPIGILPAPTA